MKSKLSVLQSEDRMGSIPELTHLIGTFSCTTSTKFNRNLHRSSEIKHADRQAMQYSLRAKDT
jgi:hypothetical protein